MEGREQWGGQGWEERLGHVTWQRRDTSCSGRCQIWPSHDPYPPSTPHTLHKGWGCWRVENFYPYSYPYPYPPKTLGVVATLVIHYIQMQTRCTSGWLKSLAPVGISVHCLIK